MSRPKIYVDTEFSRVSEPRVRPVCVSFLLDEKTYNYWTASGDYLEALCFIKKYANTHDFVAFNVESEARFFRAIGLDDKTLLSIQWIDLYLEWRMLLNHNHRLYCGEHLDGRVTPFKGSPSYSLAGAIYRMLKVRIDTFEKQRMRELIISDPPWYSQQQAEDIMNYCQSDVAYLPQLLHEFIGVYSKILKSKDKALLRQDILTRGNYAARTAIMVDTGYPINYEETKNFSDNTSLILYDCMSDINSQFPDILPFRWNKTTATYSMNTKAIKEWVVKQKHHDWEKTETGGISLKLEAFTKYYDYKHNYPRGNFGAQVVRYLKLKQSLNGFMPRKENAKTKPFWDYVGSDGRVRPYFGIYGSQSGRSQPSASGFIPLKAAWMRSLIQPRSGRAIAGIDYGSQEFLIAGLVANDENMLRAYESGDVYLAFAKGIRLVPPNATKHTHTVERNLAKSAVLGMSYLMSKVGLSHKLTQDTGKYHSEEDAQKIIDAFDELYRKNTDQRAYVQERYNTDGYIRLSDGWTMFGDNPNFRSVCNFPIQGMGACIMRKAVSLAQDRGLDIIFTLHDALYIEYNSGDFDAIDILANCMDEAFRFYFPDHLKPKANCRMDCETWSLDYQVGEIVTRHGRKVKIEKIHIDERATDEYAQFSKYFKRARNTDLDFL